jgi:hypothetical protein
LDADPPDILLHSVSLCRPMFIWCMLIPGQPGWDSVWGFPLMLMSWSDVVNRPWFDSPWMPRLLHLLDLTNYLSPKKLLSQSLSSSINVYYTSLPMCVRKWYILDLSGTHESPSSLIWVKSECAAREAAGLTCRLRLSSPCKCAAHTEGGVCVVATVWLISCVCVMSKTLKQVSLQEKGSCLGYGEKPNEKQCCVNQSYKLFVYAYTHLFSLPFIRLCALLIY